MPEAHEDRPQAGLLGRVTRATMRPLTSAAGAAAETGVNLERQAIDRLLDSRALEHVLDSPRLVSIVEQLLASDGAHRLIDVFFDSGLFDHFAERLLESDALWHLIDEIAGSPAVTAAISQQGLGFADQVGAEVRGRSRRADEWLERSARRLIHRRSATPDDAEVTPHDAEVTPDDAEVKPDDAEVAPHEAEVTPDDAEVTS